MLSFRPTEACGHAVSVFCTKQQQLSVVCINVNLFSEQTCEGSSDMVHVFIQHHPGKPYGVAAML